MKIISILSVAITLAFLTGCATQEKVTGLAGRGTKQIHAASFDQVWRAAVDAAQRDLDITSSDRSRGYIGARRTIRVHTFGENVGIWLREIAPSQTEVEVVSRQAGPPVASWRNWENEIQRAIAANLTREAVGAAPGSVIIERGNSPSTIIVPEGRETIVVPESRETLTVPETSRTRQALRDEERRLEELRTKREAGERALANEVDETKREMLQREIDRLREDLKLQQRRLQDLEQQLK